MIVHVVYTQNRRLYICMETQRYKLKTIFNILLCMLALIDFQWIAVRKMCIKH